jgi:hypothetical protein
VRVGRGLILFALAFASLSAAAAYLMRASSAPGSALSRDGLGWIVARRYAEEHGVSVRMLADPEEALGPDEALFITFPWQRLEWDRAARQARDHLREGGTLVVAFSGVDPEPSEKRFLQDLGLAQQSPRPKPPLNPLRWREHSRAEWSLVPVGGGTPGARVRQMEHVPVAPPGGETLFRSEDGLALVSSARFRGGRLLLLPAEALANSRLARTGHAELLELVLELLPRRWAFDEVHHGLVPVTRVEAAASDRMLPFFIAHLAIVYLLAVLALSRRFGPAWSDPVLTTGSARSFFVGVAALHARLGHLREAVPLLARRARELDPALLCTEDPPEGAALTPTSFLRFAQAIARAQKRRT